MAYRPILMRVCSHGPTRQSEPFGLLGLLRVVAAMQHCAGTYQRRFLFLTILRDLMNNTDRRLEVQDGRHRARKCSEHMVMKVSKMVSTGCSLIRSLNLDLVLL